MRRLLCGALALSAVWVSACGGSSLPADGGPRRDGGAASDGGIGDGGVSRPVVTITASPETGVVGQQSTFTATITGGTPPYRTCMWTYFNGDPGSSGTIAGSTCTGQHTYDSPGDYVVTALVGDNRGFVNNPPAFLTYRVVGEGGFAQPDLEVKSGSVSLVNPPPMGRYSQGSMIQVAFTIRNAGLGPAGPSAAAVFLKSLIGPSDELLLLGNAQIPALEAGAEHAARPSFSIAANQPPGPYRVVIRADATGMIDEANESNNDSFLIEGIEVVIPDGG